MNIIGLIRFTLYKYALYNQLTKKRHLFFNARISIDACLSWKSIYLIGGTMDAKKVLDRLYTFFVGFGIFIFIGTIVELSQLNHLSEELQIIPYILLPLGILLGILMLVSKSSMVHKIAIIGMWVIAVGGIIGMIVHVSGNLESVFEGGQKMAFGQMLHQAIGGEFPLLAPGTLTIGAAMILAVEYARKALAGKK
jgi:hypothetical protein